jgi:hypothetical protein
LGGSWFEASSKIVLETPETGGVAQVAGCLSCKCEVQSSNPSPNKKKEKKPKSSPQPARPHHLSSPLQGRQLFHVSQVLQARSCPRTFACAPYAPERLFPRHLQRFYPSLPGHLYSKVTSFKSLLCLFFLFSLYLNIIYIFLFKKKKSDPLSFAVFHQDYKLHGSRDFEGPHLLIALSCTS